MSGPSRSALADTLASGSSLAQPLRRVCLGEPLAVGLASSHVRSAGSPPVPVVGATKEGGCRSQPPNRAQRGSQGSDSVGSCVCTGVPPSSSPAHPGRLPPAFSNRSEMRRIHRARHPPDTRLLMRAGGGTGFRTDRAARGAAGPKYRRSYAFPSTGRYGCGSRKCHPPVWMRNIKVDY